jgi:anti-sigma factor RsiW
VSIDLEGARCEEEAARLLPWYAIGRLPAADVERVTQHLERCAICRDDLAHERELRLLMKSDDRVEYAPQAGLARTLARIDELGRDAPNSTLATIEPAALPPRRTVTSQWLIAAVVVQAIGLGVLGAALLHRTAPDATRAQYETLSTSPAQVAPGARIRAVFAPAVTLAELKTMLAAGNLTIVRGPNDAGAYTLASTEPHWAEDGRDAAIAALRSDARVLFVEPAVNGEPAAR